MNDVFSLVMFLLGGGLLLIGAIGVIRMPDFYARLHAASVIDTLGADLIILGLLLQVSSWLVAVKLILIFLVILLTSPIAVHALARFALYRGVKPKLYKDTSDGYKH